MAANPTSGLITLDQYLQSSFDPDVEFVDDHVEEKNMGSIPHSILQAELAFWFLSHRELWGIRVMTEVRTRTGQTRVRLPDVCVVLEGEVGSGTIQTTPPLIAIEILSPEDRWNRIIPRLKEFLGIGVKNIWLLDPIDRAAFSYATHGIQLVEDSRLTVPDSPIYLDLPQLFATLD